MLLGVDEELNTYLPIVNSQHVYVGAYIETDGLKLYFFENSNTLLVVTDILD